MELTDFMKVFAGQLEQKIDETLKPIYKMQNTEDDFGSKIRPFPIQREIVKALKTGYKTGKKALFLNGEMGSGKCQKPDTLITINNELITIETAWVRYAQKETEHFDGEGYWYNANTNSILTPSFNEQNGKIELKQVKHFYRQQINETIRKVSLFDGSFVETTMAHSFLTPYGWTNKIKEGDYVAVPIKEPHLPNQKSIIDPELLGWAIGEGCFILHDEKTRTGTLSISQKDENQLRKIAQLLQQIPDIKFNVKFKKSQNKCPAINVTSQKLIKLFEDNGYPWGLKSVAKYVPSFLASASQKEIATFLRALFDADGYVCKDRTLVEYTTASWILANQIRSLLRKICIYSIIKKQMKAATNTPLKIKKPYYAIGIGGSDARTFAEKIGSTITEKIKRLLSISNRLVNNNINTIYTYDITRELKTETGLGRKITNNLFANVYLNGLQKTMNIETAQKLLILLNKIINGSFMTELINKSKPENTRGKSNYTKLIKKLKNADINKLIQLKNELSKRINSDIIFVRVKRIETYNYEGWVYDMEIEKTHNFIGNNIILHNTLEAIWTAENIKAKRVLIICPPHIVSQWKEEILKAYPKKRVAIIPDPQLRKLNISNMATLQTIHKDRNIDFVIISREAIKTDFPTRDAVINNKRRGYLCPGCLQELNYETILKRKKTKTFCDKCGSALFTYCKDGNRAKPSLAKYIQRKMRGFFDFTVFDEAHELKAEESAQGAVLGKLGTKTRVLAMTGTLMGGKASDIFYLLQRTNPTQIRQEGFGHKSVSSFVESYGVLEKIYKEDERDNRYSIGRKRIKESLRERPGISPLVIGNFLIDKTAFVRLSDFAEKLPLYLEHPMGCKLHPGAEEGYNALTGYKDLLSEANKPAKIISSAIQAMLAYPDTHRQEVICDEDEDGNEVPVMIVPEVDIPLGETEKEQRLLEIVKEAKDERKKVLIYTTQTKKRDIQPRIAKLLEKNRIKTAVMYNSITTGKRKGWIEKKTDKIDALICHPRLVALGMNLLEYPVIVFFDTGYSTYTLRQASRRSYRINQTREQIDVYYLYTIDTIQQDCLSLMACKNEVSLMAEGEIQEGGLSIMSNGVGSILSQLAKVINGELKTENPLEVFSRLNKLNNEGKKKPVEQEITQIEEINTVDTPVKVCILPIMPIAGIQMSLF